MRLSLLVLFLTLLGVAINKAALPRAKSSLGAPRDEQFGQVRQTPFGPAIDVWNAGMETRDLSEWELPGSPNEGGGEFNSDGGDAIASTEQARSGEWSAKLFLQSGSGGTRLFRWREPREYSEAYFSAWFYFPISYTPALWWNIFQFKSKTETKNDPFWVINVGNRSDGTMFLYLVNSMTEQSFTQDVIDLPVETWVNISCFLRQSAVSNGMLTCWQDETLLWDMSGITTRHLGGDNEWSINNYSSGVSPAPVVIYVDDASVSLSPAYPDSILDTTIAGLESPTSGSATVADPSSQGWTARHGEANWLSLATTSGLGTGVVSWSRDAAGLSPGTFVDTIFLESPTFGSAQVVDILSVGEPVIVLNAAKHLMTGDALTPIQAHVLDKLGNLDGDYNLGDLLAWHDKCAGELKGGCGMVASMR